MLVYRSVVGMASIGIMQLFRLHGFVQTSITQQTLYEHTMNDTQRNTGLIDVPQQHFNEDSASVSHTCSSLWFKS